MWLGISMILFSIGVGIAAVVGLIKGASTFLDFQYDWKKCKSLDAKLSFSQFIKFYELHPKQWYLYDTHIERRNPNDYRRDIEVGFNSWLDFAKYRRWYKRYEEEKELESKTKAEQEQMGRLLELIKADIKMVERQSQNEISSAQKTMEKVIGIDNDSADEKSSDTQAESGKRYFYYEGHQVMCGSTVYAIVDFPNLLVQDCMPVRQVCKCIVSGIDFDVYTSKIPKNKLYLVIDDGSSRICKFLSRFSSDDFGHRLFLTREEADKTLKNMAVNRECYITEDGGLTYAGFTY